MRRGYLVMGLRIAWVDRLYACYIKPSQTMGLPAGKFRYRIDMCK